MAFALAGRSSAPVFPQGLPFSNTPQISWEPDSRHLVFAVEADASHHYQLYMADVRNGGYWPVFMEDRPALPRRRFRRTARAWPIDRTSRTPM